MIMFEKQESDFGFIDYIQLLIYFVILIFGVVGNIFVIFVVRSKKMNCKINDYFIFNLVISDFCMLIVSILVDFYLKF